MNHICGDYEEGAVLLVLGPIQVEDHGPAIWLIQWVNSQSITTSLIINSQTPIPIRIKIKTRICGKNANWASWKESRYGDGYVPLRCLWNTAFDMLQVDRDGVVRVHHWIHRNSTIRYPSLTITFFDSITLELAVAAQRYCLFWFCSSCPCRTVGMMIGEWRCYSRRWDNAPSTLRITIAKSVSGGSKSQITVDEREILNSPCRR